jgi:hypothetical protein
MTAGSQRDHIDHWMSANRRYLDSELRCLRLRLRRRMCWLRRQWRHDSLGEYRGDVISDARADWLVREDLRADEARFYESDAEAMAITAAIREADAETARQTQVLREAGTPHAVDLLAQRFSLSESERRLLLLALAPELDATLEPLYAYVQDDVSRKYATLHLALSLYGGTDEASAELRECLLPDRPLRRFALARLDAGAAAETRAGQHLRLDERIADYLLGTNRIDERVASLLRTVAPAPLTAAHEEMVARLLSWMAGRRPGPWPVVNLVGARDAGAAAVARALCDRCSVRVSRLDVTRLSQMELVDQLRLIERESALMQMALFVDVSAHDARDERSLAILSEVVDRLEALLLIGSARPWPTDRPILAVRMPQGEPAQQRALWEQALEASTHALNGELGLLAEQFTFGPEAVAHAVSRAGLAAALRTPAGDAAITAQDLWAACRMQAAAPLDDLAQAIAPRHTWDDIVLPGDSVRQLREICAQIAHRATVYEAWGFGAKLNRGRGIGALFAGPSGTGKTMAAEIIAGELGLDLYRIDLAGAVSKYIGETEKNLRRVFDAAEQGGAILFFDEADALFGKRSEVRDSHDRYANIEVDYLLQRMEEFRGLAILATNMKSQLDQAFLRRLRFVVDFPAPDAAQRRQIWQKVFPPQAALDGLDYDALARLEIAGGNIKNIAVNAAFLAAAEGGRIGMAHVLTATRREYTKIDKLLRQSELGRYHTLVSA